LKPASRATDDDIIKTTDDGDTCRSDDPEHIPVVVIVGAVVTTKAENVIGKVDIVVDLDRTNAADDAIGNCITVDVDGVNMADEIIGDVTVDTDKEWKK